MGKIRIFISSPSDVAEERLKAREVIFRLQGRYAGQAELVPVLWEELPLQADMSFQQGIDLVLGQESGIDIAVFILWSRLGSPLGPLVRKDDGTDYRSGTEREFDLMWQAREQSLTQTGILAYTRRDDETWNEFLDARKTDETLEGLLEQRRLARQFIEERFHDPEGHNIRAYHTYQKPAEFCGRLRAHLIGLLDDLLGDRAGAIVWEGNPYVGLEAFSFEQERIFRGRERETCEVAERLRIQAAKGCAFLLILGASGSGKSSMARAGLLPALCLHEVDESVAQWRHATLLPSLHNGDLLLALVRTLAVTLPELVELAPAGLDKLAQDLQANPETIVANNLALAFAAAAKTAKGPVRLVLLVDQLEEAFTDGGISPSQREVFFTALAALASSGHVWVIATLRSDFYAQAQESPALREARGEGGTYDLAGVDQAALRRIIASPAAMAGVRFENETGKQKTGLEERILNEALAHTEALPHLEYLLQERYERRDQTSHLLTHAAFDQLGGVNGVLGRRATTTFAQLQPQLGEEGAAQAFDRLMRALVTVQPEGRRKAARRRAPLAPMQSDSDMNRLCQALISARLLATDRGPGDEPLVTIAHEALFTSWDRISYWIDDILDFLKERARVEAAAQLWEENERSGDYLLADGLPLARARDLRQRHASDLGPLEQTFISTSIEQAEARRKAELRKLRTRNLVYAGLACCAFVAAGLAGWQHELSVYYVKIATVLEAKKEAARAAEWWQNKRPLPNSRA